MKAAARASKTDGSSLGFPAGSMVGKRTVTEYVRYVDMTVRSVVLPDELEAKDGSDKRCNREEEFDRGVEAFIRKQRCRWRSPKAAKASSYCGTLVRDPYKDEHFHTHTSSNATSLPSTLIAALSISTSSGRIWRSTARFLAAAATEIATLGGDAFPEDFLQPD